MNKLVSPSLLSFVPRGPAAMAHQHAAAGGGLTQVKRGVIMAVANDHSIAWGFAKTLAQHGAKLAFTFQGDALAKRVKPLAAEAGSSFLMPCDVEDIASVDAVFSEIKKQWGTMDFLVHAVAFSDKNELKGRYADSTRDNFIR